MQAKALDPKELDFNYSFTSVSDFRRSTNAFRDNISLRNSSTNKGSGRELDYQRKPSFQVNLKLQGLSISL